MSDGQDQLEFAADDARHSSSTPHPGKYHEMMDNIEELKDFIKEQEREIARLRTLIDNYQSVRTKALVEMTEKRDMWKAAAESHERHMDISNSTNASLMSDLRDLRHSLDAHKASADSLTADLRTVNDVNDRLKLEISQLHNSLKAMTVSRNEWSEKAESREVKLANEILCIASLQEQVECLEGRIASLKQSYVSRESAEVIARLTADLNEWKDVASKGSHEIGCLNAEIADLRRTRSDKDLEKEVATLTMERDNWKDTAYNWKDAQFSCSGDLRNANHAIDRLKAENQSLRNSLADSNASQWKGLAEGRLKVMGELNATITDLQQQVEASKKEAECVRVISDEWRERSISNSPKIATLADEIESLKRLCGNWQTTANLRLDEINKLKSSTGNSELREKIERLEANITIKDAEFTDIAKTLATMTDDRDWWRGHARDKRETANQQSVKIIDLERTLASTKSANEYLKRDLDEANAENAEQAKEIRDLQVLVNDLNVKVHNLKTSYSDTDGWIVAGSRLETIESQSNQIKNLDADVARLTKEVSLAYGNGENARQWIIDEQGKEISRLKGEVKELLLYGRNSSPSTTEIEQSKQIKTLQDGLEDMRARYIAAQKAMVEMGQFHSGSGMDSVVIPKDELRDRLNSLRMADPDEAGWNTLAKTVRDITKYFERKIGQK